MSGQPATPPLIEVLVWVPVAEQLPDIDAPVVMAWDQNALPETDWATPFQPERGWLDADGWHLAECGGLVGHPPTWWARWLEGPLVPAIPAPQYRPTIPLGPLAEADMDALKAVAEQAGLKDIDLHALARVLDAAQRVAVAEERERWRAAASLAFDALALDAGAEQVQREADALRDIGALLRA